MLQLGKLAEFPRKMAEGWENLKEAFFMILVCKNRNRTALVRELLSNKSLSVSRKKINNSRYALMV